MNMYVCLCYELAICVFASILKKQIPVIILWLFVIICVFNITEQCTQEPNVNGVYALNSSPR